MRTNGTEKCERYRICGNLVGAGRSPGTRYCIHCSNTRSSWNQKCINRKTNRQKVRHGGLLITINHKAETDSLKVTELKAVKPKRPGRKR